jgi:hypothetical protein
MTPIHLRIYLLLSIALQIAFGSYGFVLVGNHKASCLYESTAIHVASNNEDWISLVELQDKGSQSPVRKLVIEEGDGNAVQKGSSVEIEYIGTLVGEQDWTSEDVISCWLSELQGLNHLSEVFLEKGIDGSMLMDETKFTEDFCTNELDISNKIQAKKLVMAARRIAKQQQDHEAGSEFDSSHKRGKNFSFVLGRGKVIKAMDLAVSTSLLVNELDWSVDRIMHTDQRV